MGLLGLWLIALAMIASIGLFVAVAIATHPRGDLVGRAGRRQQHEEIVRRACADLDREYRELLNR